MSSRFAPLRESPKLGEVPRFVAAALLAAALSACTMAPRYERPAAPVSPRFPDAPDATSSPAPTAAATASNAPSPGLVESAPAAEIGWREFFPDPQLQTLIERALANNRDLRIAALNVEAARAAYRIQRSNLVPRIDAQGEAFSQRVPESLSTTGDSYVARQYTAALGVTAFELDLFGRVRSLRKSALEEYLSLDETRMSVHLSLVAEVANAWLTLMADRELLKLTRETLQSQRSSFELTRLRFSSGVVSELDLHQAEIAVRNAEVNIAAYSRRVALDKNALALLLGEPLPAELASDDVGSDAPTIASQLLTQDLTAGLPADLLERRPDIRAAEHALQARNADIGAARAAFFPRISLTGSYGQAHSDLTGLFDTQQRAWSFAPQLTLPIFAGGANAANLDLAHVRKRIEIARYEQAIQSAFREVADALVARRTLSEQLAAQESLTRAAGQTYALSDMRYRGGVDTYLNSLIAQRDHYLAQQTLIDLRLAQASNAVSLYKALGGGWVERR